MRLGPGDLSTLGYDDFGGALSGRFATHPKHDPATGQLVFFSYSAIGRFSPGMSWGTIERTGHVSRYEIFEAPDCGMVHDFGVTAAHVVFPVFLLTGDIDRARAGRPAFAWEPGKGAYIGIIRRDRGTASLTWQAIEPRFSIPDDP